MGLAVVEGLLVDVVLDLLEELGDVVGDAFEGVRLLGEGVAASYLDGALL